MKNDFTTARFKLILLYLLIIGSVITLFSLLIIYQASDSFSDPAVLTSDNLLLNADEAMALAKQLNPEKTVVETEYEIENAQLYFTVSFDEETEVKVNLLTGEANIPRAHDNFFTMFTDDFDEMVIWIGLGVFLLAGLLCMYVANKTLAPIARNIQKQKQFVSDSAHELRNPLSALHARIEALLRVPQTLPLKAMLDDLLSETKRLIAISEGLLSLEKGEKESANVQDISLQKGVAAVVTRLAHTIRDKKITMHTHIDKNTVYIDEGDLETVLYNLIHNAIKFTQDGTVTVTFKDKTLFVTDTGIGIAQKHIPHLFDRFYKADASRSEGGSGLGLSLVKTLTDKYGAKLTVQSSEGKGSTFAVIFK